MAFRDAASAAPLIALGFFVAGAAFADQDAAKALNNTVGTSDSPARAASELAVHSASPESLALARRLETTLNIRPGTEKILALRGKDYAQQFRASLQHFPIDQQNRMMISFEQAYRDTSELSVNNQLDRWVQYFATHLDLNELRQIDDFYRTPIGSKMVLTPQSVTPEERQIAGRAMLDHPEILKLLAASTGFMQMELSQAPVRKAAFQANLKEQLCKKLAGAGFRSSACGGHP